LNDAGEVSSSVAAAGRVAGGVEIWPVVAYGLVMVMSGLPDPGSFGAAFVEFMRVMSLAAEERESEVAVRLREHLGAIPRACRPRGCQTDTDSVVMSYITR
jgi:hypothetical protein